MTRRTFGPRFVPGRGGIVLAVFVVALMGWITLNTLTSDSPGSQGLPAGRALPPFAMPLAASSCRGRCDANVAQHQGQGAAGARPACQVHGPEILNSCELGAGPFVLAFVFQPLPKCRDELAVLARARARHPSVRFAAVAVRADGPTARSLARLHPGLPVAYDHDGAVANEYAVVVCPTITFGRAGRVTGSTVGPLGAGALEGWLRRIE